MRKPEAVVVKTGKTTYADLVKKVAVTSMKKTRAGDLRMEVGKGKRMAEQLRNAIAEKIQEAALRAAVKDKDIEVYVRTLRSAFAKTHVAVVEMPQQAAMVILEKRRITVGMVTCRPRECVRVVQCYRCRGYGHMTSSCSEERAEECCHNCGEEGHKRAECQNRSYCTVCRKKGHSSGTHGCSKHREALEEARRENKRCK